MGVKAFIRLAQLEAGEAVDSIASVPIAAFETNPSEGSERVMPSVAIIGSFKTRERYAAVRASIEIFRAQGWTVTSPAGTSVLQPDIDFVRFESDDPDLSDAEVQSKTLERIMSADITYVTAPGGYIGRTTCYEVGRIVQAGRPIFFSEAPLDLPIRVATEFIADAAVVARDFKARKAPGLFEVGDDAICAVERRLISRA